MRRRYIGIAIALLLLIEAGGVLAGYLLGPTMLHPMRINPERWEQMSALIERAGATRIDFQALAPDGVRLDGSKIKPVSPSGDWVLLFHGVSDNRTGVLGRAEFLLRHGFSVVLVDARAHGESGGDTATFGSKERYDSVAITDALYATEKVRHFYALGVSMGAAIALQSAAVEPRIERVIAEDPFANLREAAYDYAGFHFSPFLGKTLFRVAALVAVREAAKEGQFDPDEVSPEEAVTARPFPVLLICGTMDHTIPCRHAEQIYQAARGYRELWIVNGAGHASALGHAPGEYERRVVKFLGGND